MFAEWSDVGPSVIDLAADTPMVPCGDAEVIADQMAHGFDAPYLRAMDAQGIDVVVPDPRSACSSPSSRSWTRRRAQPPAGPTTTGWPGTAPKDERRMAGVGLVRLADVGLAIAEVQHAAGLGLVGVLVRPNHLRRPQPR